VQAQDVLNIIKLGLANPHMAINDSILAAIEINAKFKTSGKQ
jgi:hypothetical protein